MKQKLTRKRILEIVNSHLQTSKKSKILYSTSAYYYQGKIDAFQGVLDYIEEEENFNLDKEVLTNE